MGVVDSRVGLHASTENKVTRPSAAGFELRRHVVIASNPKKARLSNPYLGETVSLSIWPASVKSRTAGC